MYSPRIVHPEVKTERRWFSRVASGYHFSLYLSVFRQRKFCFFSARRQCLCIAVILRGHVLTCLCGGHEILSVAFKPDWRVRSSGMLLSIAGRVVHDVSRIAIPSCSGSSRLVYLTLKIKARRVGDRLCLRNMLNLCIFQHWTMGKVQKLDDAKLGTVCYRQNPEELNWE